MKPYTHEELTVYCNELINYMQDESKVLSDKTKSEIWQEVRDIESKIYWSNQLTNE